MKEDEYMKEDMWPVIRHQNTDVLLTFEGGFRETSEQAEIAHIQYLIDMGLINPNPGDASFDYTKVLKDCLEFESIVCLSESKKKIRAQHKDYMTAARNKFEAPQKKDLEMFDMETDSIFQDAINWVKDDSNSESEHESALPKHRRSASVDDYINRNENKHKHSNNFQVVDDLNRASSKESNLIKRSPLQLMSNIVNASRKRSPDNYIRPNYPDITTWETDNDIPTLKQYIDKKQILKIQHEYSLGENNVGSMKQWVTDYDEIYGHRAEELMDQQKRAEIERWLVPGAIEHHQYMLDKLELVRNHYTTKDLIDNRNYADRLIREAATLRKKQYREKLGADKKNEARLTNNAEHRTKYVSVKHLLDVDKATRTINEREKKQKYRASIKAKKADAKAAIEADKKSLQAQHGL